MSDLIILAYRSQDTAFVAGEALAALQQEAGTEPEDIVVVSRDANGKVQINQSVDLATGQPLGGGKWGMLIGMLFLDRRKLKTESAGLAAQFKRAGVPETFLDDVRGALVKNGAAIGMRVRLLGADRVIERARTLNGTPEVFRCRLSAEAESNLYDMQDRIPEQVLSHVQGAGDF
jgi:uncharacterized membrane protein